MRARRLLVVTAATVVLAGAAVAGLAAAGSSRPSVEVPPPATAAPASSAAPGSTPALAWRETPTGSTARLRGLAPVSRDVAWVAGAGPSGGVVLHTTDAGATWTAVGPSPAVGLDLRDIEATSATHAVVLATGSGAASRILVTDDGGATWTETFRNTDEQAFYDCMAFSTPQRGLAVSDPVDGVFRFVETSDGGRSWTSVNPDGTPAALPNEFAVAASGSCLTAGPGGTAYLATGGENPRVFSSRNLGHTWSVAEVPLAAGPSGGAMSVRFRDARTGLVVGGDVSDPTSRLGTAAWTDDGLTWHPADAGPGGYRSAVAFLPATPALPSAAVAVGPGGSDVSVDAGRHWSPLGAVGYDTVDCSGDGACWAAGDQGRVARLSGSGR